MGHIFRVQKSIMPNWHYKWSEEAGLIVGSGTPRYSKCTIGLIWIVCFLPTKWTSTMSWASSYYLTHSWLNHMTRKIVKVSYSNYKSNYWLELHFLEESIGTTCRWRWRWWLVWSFSHPLMDPPKYRCAHGSQ